MKVKLCVSREVEIEVNVPVVAELDNYWRTHEMVNQAVRTVEHVSGIPFGDDTATETITAVLAMDGEPIIEW